MDKLILLKTQYNQALARYNNMIENVPEEKQKANYKFVEIVINECNDLLNKIKAIDALVTDREILRGFKI